MPRYKIVVEYNGTNYAGWQIQKGEPSIQEELQKAVFGFSGEAVIVTGAGRTDAGVHALGQVAHFDCTKVMSSFHMCQALNAYLRPQPISVLSAEIVPDDFSARFSAVERSYLYRILNRRSRPALDDGRVWWVGAPLNVEAMRDAATVFLGKHDFTTFRAVACQAKSPVRTLEEFSVTKNGDYIDFHLRARSFLHHQVRNMVGTLKLVGEGHWDKARVIKALEAKDRKEGGPTAPPDGLYFESVKYPETIVTNQDNS